MAIQTTNEKTGKTYTIDLGSQVSFKLDVEHTGFVIDIIRTSYGHDLLVEGDFQDEYVDGVVNIDARIVSIY